uniref:Jacalin-type lectin domain-containing protein n=1 Tax=Brassica campestris TaxID=3711 RepID=M4FBK7_BRACM
MTSHMTLMFGYLTSEDDEALTLSTKFGPSEGHSFRAVILKQDEYVTGLSGVHGYGMRDGIKSLTFHTNCGEHRPTEV